MTTNIQARAGQIIGLDHMARRVNCQDSYALIQTDDYLIGIVCDGCGEGKNSEVGAKLAAQVISRQVFDLLNEGIPVRDVPALLYPRVVAYLDQLVETSCPIDPVSFVRDYLLFTIIGVIQAGDDGVIFAAGDGTFALDDTVFIRDQNNAPAYIAYNLIDPQMLKADLSLDGFDVYPCPAHWQRLAIMTDGFDTDLIPHIWGQRHPRGLQRKLNVWSDQERRFRDDATLIAVERVSVPVDEI